MNKILVGFERLWKSSRFFDKLTNRQMENKLCGSTNQIHDFKMN